MKSIVLFLTFFSCICFNSWSQTGGRCGSEEYMQHLKATKPEAFKQINAFKKELGQLQRNSLRTSASTDTVIHIPVVIHVVHDVLSGTIGGKNISDAQIQSQITVLNNDYQRLNADQVNTPVGYLPIAANVKLQFCLANRDPFGNYTSGITRTYNNKASYGVYDASLLSSLTYWPSDQYLNIWVCDISGNVLGYAQQPGSSSITGLDPNDGVAETDGVVIDYTAFGTIGNLQSKYNLGRTTTHEVGHWFGLSHPWGDYNSGDCSLTDYCADTPPCGNAFTSAVPLCSNIPTGSGSVVCTPSRMIQNYMDYSDDGCMNLFTQDQKSRMRSTMEFSARRYALFSSLGCCNITGTILAAPYAKSFEDSDISSDGWSSINPNSSSTYTKGFELNNYSAFDKGGYCTSVTNDSVYVESIPNTHKYSVSYISPYLNLKTVLSPTLFFDWAYSPKVKNGQTDSIGVYVTQGCSNNWVLIKRLYGNDFTSTNQQRSLFKPTADEWQTTEIDLSTYSNNAGMRIKFVSFSKGINTFYLDNINITASSPTLFVNVYPNPASDIIKITSVFEGKRNIDYVLYNLLGQLILKTQDQNVYSYTREMDLSGLASGIYILQVSEGNQKLVRKIVKQ
ncbi:T9SS type A sorting domain-containing protein [uncultured Cytophaga sp.]|uniref:T9SS type A sorting domain-containing protein n=1 Tax=uncultured Cytophaga sp. TaxID=160238 RepID=UPI00260199F5|nr:T9SS type A sorting domain-containing protein [uncultured Cytophaga sp.]